MNPLSPVRSGNYPEKTITKGHSRLAQINSANTVNINQMLKGRIKEKKTLLLFSDFVAKLNSEYARHRYITYLFESGFERDICKDFVFPDLVERKYGREVTSSSASTKINNVENLFPNGKKAEKNRFLIEANPGGGKTTICRYIANAFADLCWHDQFKVVIWINLKDLVKDSTPKNLYQAISLLYSIGTEKSVRELLSPIESEILFLVDGYDEVDSHFTTNENLRRVFSEIRGMSNWIITSRPGVFPRRSNQEEHYLEMVGFNHDETVCYIENFYRKFEDSSKANAMIKFVKERPDLYPIISIPIILEIICSLFLHQKQPLLLNTHTDVYEGMFVGILKRYFEKNGNTAALSWGVETLVKKLHFPESICSLEESAFKELETLPTSFHFRKPNGVVSEQYASFVEETASLGFTKCDIKNNDKPRETHYFLHQTFHEYFAARYFANCIRENRDIDEKPWKEFVQKKKFNQKYALVFRFTAGLLTSPKLEEFITEIVSPPNSLLGIHEWVLVAQCLEEVKDGSASQLRSAVTEKVFNWLHRMVDCKFTDLESVAKIFRGLKKFYVGPEILHFLSPCTSFYNAPVNFIGALGVDTPPVANKLLELYFQFHFSSEWEVLYAFRWIRYESEEMVGRLIQNLKDETHRVALELGSSNDENAVECRVKTYQTLKILGLIEPHTDEKVQVLIDLLQYKNYRYEVIHTLSYIQPKSAQALRQFITLLSSPDDETRSCTLEVIANIKPTSEDVILAVINLLGDTNERIAKKAYETLKNWKLKSIQVEARLIALLSQGNFKISLYAADILASIGPRSEEFIESQIQIFRNRGILTPMAIQILLNMRLESVVLREHLQQFFRDTDPEMRVQAVRVVGFFTSLMESLRERLQPLLKDENEQVRFDAGKVLLKLNANLSEAVDIVFGSLINRESRNSTTAKKVLVEILPKSQVAKDKIWSYLRSIQELDFVRVEMALISLSEKKTLSKIVCQLLIDLVEAHCHLTWRVDPLFNHLERLLENEDNIDKYADELIKIANDQYFLKEAALEEFSRPNFDSIKICILIDSNLMKHSSLTKHAAKMIPKSDAVLGYLVENNIGNYWHKEALKNAQPENDVSLETVVKMCKSCIDEVFIVALNYVKSRRMSRAEELKFWLNYMKDPEYIFYSEFSIYFRELVLAGFNDPHFERTLLLEGLAALIVLTHANAILKSDYIEVFERKIHLLEGEKVKIEDGVNSFLEMKVPPMINPCEGINNKLQEALLTSLDETSSDDQSI